MQVSLQTSNWDELCFSLSKHRTTCCLQTMSCTEFYNLFWGEVVWSTRPAPRTFCSVHIAGKVTQIGLFAHMHPFWSFYCSLNFSDPTPATFTRGTKSDISGLSKAASAWNLVCHLTLTSLQWDESMHGGVVVHTAAYSKLAGLSLGLNRVLHRALLLPPTMHRHAC